MMKVLFRILCVVLLPGMLLIGCNSSSPQKIAKVSKYDKLLTLYKPINIDTLKVFSDGNLDRAGYKFKGKLIDSVIFRLFPGTNIYTNPYLYNQFFATYKFNVDSNTIGLITRVPSQYDCTSIKMFFYDKKLDRLADGFELADGFGDENWSFEKTGWIFRNKKKEYNYFIYNRDLTLHGMEIDSVADTSSTIINTYSLIGMKHDTINKNAIALFNKFRNKK